jgi:hypothetical protein
VSPAPSAHRIAVACALSCALLASVMSGPAAAHDGGGGADVHASVALAGAKAQQKQDLRSADARDAAAPRRPVNAPGANAQQKQDLRSADARDAAAPRPVNPRPIAPAPVVHASDTGSGIDWTTIGLGIAGSLLVLGGIAAVALHSRRVSRTRVAA